MPTYLYISVVQFYVVHVIITTNYHITSKYQIAHYALKILIIYVLNKYIYICTLLCVFSLYFILNNVFKVNH